jgi:hypothetical protein
MGITDASAISVQYEHKNMTGNISDPECSGCHFASQTEYPEHKLIQPTKDPIFNSMEGSNYTSILTFGQTPYQLGPFFNGGSTFLAGWSWWDSDGFGTEKQKNLISLMVLDKITGKPVTGLASNLTSNPDWPQASFRKHSGNYSYKADTEQSPITIQSNYTNKTEIWMIKDLDLSGYSNAELTFWTWYAMEMDWDYGYVAVSLDGNSWNNLPGTLTTTYNPNGNNLENGITGSSVGWVQETMDLTSYAGNKILLGFRFKSDDFVSKEGWYVDDIHVTSGTTNIFSDGAETPILSVNVSYPHLKLNNSTDPLTFATKLEYSTYMDQVNLKEDISHPGTYIGYFKYDQFAEYYSGNYSVTLDTMINGSQVTAIAQFQTTILGCQSCHNKKLSDVETSFVHGEGGGMQSCMFLCHGASRGFFSVSDFPSPFMGPPLPANPMHVHEMQYGHKGGFLDGAWYTQPPYNVSSHVSEVSCIQCHTSFLHNNNSENTMKIGNYTLFGENISFSSGTHENLTCEYCHGSLAYPAIPQNQYQLQGSLGKYKPSFTSSESFTDTYIISVDRSDNISIAITGDNPVKTIEIYAIGPIDNTTTALQGPCDNNPCDVIGNLSSQINMIIPYPFTGTWIIKVIQLQDGIINYNISSNYAIERKPIIKIPECNSCHNTGGIDKAYTTDRIPDWNPGFAHADANKDGTLDVQCRMCHDAMHEITVKDCHNCHSTVPVIHPIKEPLFSEYKPEQCLECHGDPHEITGATNCIACHSPGDVNISLFGRHGKINDSNGAGNVTNDDCWTCHFKKDMNRSNVYLCESCHINSTGIVNITNTSFIKSDFMHGMTTCKTCHAPATPGVPNAPAYHLNGTVGPLGLVEKILRKII